MIFAFLFKKKKINHASREEKMIMMVASRSDKDISYIYIYMLSFICNGGFYLMKRYNNNTLIFLVHVPQDGSIK